MSGTIENQGNVDINGDGLADEAIVTRIGTTTTFTVFINDGNGRYSSPQSFTNYAAAETGDPRLLFTTTGTYVYTPYTVVSYSIEKLNASGVFVPTTTSLNNIGSTITPPAILPTGAIDPAVITLIPVAGNHDGVATINFDIDATVSPPKGSSGLGSDLVGLDFEDLSTTGTVTDTIVAEAHSGAAFSLITTSLFEGVTTASATSGTLPNIPCYCRGTRIMTSRGEVMVQDLSVGDKVLTTLAGRQTEMPVRWLGHRKLNLAGLPHMNEVQPVRILVGALGSGIPRRDLLVSPGHRMHIDGGLICAIDLVNGATITQEKPASVEYWHVELDTHAILVAEGAEAESYLDTGNRAGFENGAVMMLHAKLDGDAADPCMLYAMTSSAIRERLIGRAEELGWTRGRDAEPWLDVDGTRIDATRHGHRYRFALPDTANVVRLRSRSATPSHTDAASNDLRRLGVALMRLTLVGPHGAFDVSLNDERLSAGFSHVEQDEAGWSWRWTDGDAHLPLDLLSRGCALTHLDVSFECKTLRFWQAPTGAASGVRLVA